MVIPINGQTTYTINLDPSVWIFDKRKIDLTHWLQTGEQQKVKERDVSGSYAIPLRSFLENAEPNEQATAIKCHRRQGENVLIPLNKAYEALIGFAHDGKPLRLDGPIHVYIPEHNHPITHVMRLEVKE